MFVQCLTWTFVLQADIGELSLPHPTGNAFKHQAKKLGPSSDLLKVNIHFMLGRMATNFDETLKYLLF